MKKRLYKKGDIVKVWSLQSFSNGGFLKGVYAVVRQDQLKNKDKDSLMLILERNFSGEYHIDPSYEVYSQQVQIVRKAIPEHVTKTNDFLFLINSTQHKKAIYHMSELNIKFSEDIINGEINFNISPI